MLFRSSEYRRQTSDGTRFNSAFNKALSLLKDEKIFVKEFIDKCGLTRQRFLESLSTIGSGNHFAEFGELNGRYYITVHTGSRQVGLKVANHYQQIAKKKLEESGEKWDFNLNEAAYLIGEDADNYLASMMIAHAYAMQNRIMIMDAIVKAIEGIGIKIGDHRDLHECIHNFISFKDGTIRKGAISSQRGEFLIVPLSSAAGIIIGHGKGNSEWNCSAPHGAGRVLSRSQANRDLTAEQIAEAMDGVYASCTSADESPLAYKDPDMIIEAVAGTMDIIGIVKPFLSIKSGKSDEH